ncbi:DUF4123 domain-containing protein [Pseudomonas syringae]|nr:DUF4123 domain-containing protein [Pseudomonas syringae]MCF5067582.1 DUF4123 domain-containing protein [Pseudomonas syringae]
MPPDFQPRAWLATTPLKSSEQLFAIFSSASSIEPLKAWQHCSNTHVPHSIWDNTAYAEWDAVMPYVGIVDADSEFLDWVATTESRDWGWLAVSSASLEVVVEHFRSLTQVLTPEGKAVFFRFWDGRFLLPILLSAEVDAAQLLPVIERGLINGQAIEINGTAKASERGFPWWQVPESVVAQVGVEVQIRNALLWLSENHPALYEAFPETVLCRKVERFFVESGPGHVLLDYLAEELD